MPLRIGALLALLLSSSAALAQQCPVPEGASSALGQVDVNLRLKFLNEAMNRDATNGTIWRWGWVGGWGAVVVTQGVLIPFMKQPSDRIQRYVGGAASIVGMLPPLLMPLEVTKDGPEFDAKVKAAGNSGTPDERCALLKFGETLAARSAENEIHKIGWVNHVVNLGFNAVVAAILGFGFHDWVGAAVAGGSGFVLSESQILSQPTRLHDQWELYRSGNLSGEEDKPPAGHDAPQIGLSVQPGYVGVNGVF